MRDHFYILLFFGILFLSGEATAQKVFYDENVHQWEDFNPPAINELNHTVFLIGDIKHPSYDPAVVNLLKEKMDQSTGESSLILLGDIVYPIGLPEKESEGYEAAKADLDAILERIQGFTGNVVFLPGNHDWSRGRKEGWNHVKNEQNYINQQLGRENVYLPVDGCPGPMEVPLSEDIIAIVFDSQWWFHQNEKPGPDDGCGFEDKAGLFIQIEDIIRRHERKKIIFATHHPLYSAGNHGGYFPATRLLFPLLDINKALYIPLPGFIYTWYRKYLGHIQDIAHPEYKIFKENMLEIFYKYPNIIYASGHEHNLQYFKHDSLFHIISGGGGEGLYIAKKKKNADFAIDNRGLSILHFYNNGDAWIEYWIPDETKNGKLVFRTKMFNQEIYKQEDKIAAGNETGFPNQTFKTKLTDIYNRGGFTRAAMGDNYREIWNTEVTLPVFDISAENGGLTILKRGGGQQTRSVRMENKNGQQYVLRSVNKYVEKALEAEMRNTIAEDAVQDAISASHPYAALTVPKMADAVGVMHTNPKIVYVPDDPALGIYRRDLANDVFLYEERPAGDRSDMNSFGNSKKIVNTLKTIDKTQKEHDHVVDQEAVLRARLFDILLNDWDRHDDQWRWATFKENDQTVYRPVPRDRDQVYFVNEGFIMWLASRDFIMPKFQGFDHEIKNVKGLGFNARYFDRSFITEPGLENWKNTARSIQENLSDEIIDAAMLDFPKEVYDISGEDIGAKLKSRRDHLHLSAEKYYRFLSREVDIVGTDKRELFNIQRFENGNTDISVFAVSKKKGKIKERIYHREFNPKETKEIRLYGLDGEDKFEISGTAKKAIKIRLIGGKNNDSIIDHSKIRGAKKTVLVYDRKDKKNFYTRGKETRLILSKDKSIDDYNRKQYKFDKAMPLISAGYNVDDGFFIGGGININRYNFRDSIQHKISGTLAFETGAFGLEYDGLYTTFSQFFDLEIHAGISMPRNVDNFYGFGNETEKITEDKTYYRVRYEYGFLNPMLKRTVSKSFSYSLGVFYQYFSINDTANRYIGDMNLNMLDSLVYKKHHFTGLNAHVEMDTRNSEVLPQRGMHWITSASGFYGLNDQSKNFVRISSDMRFYLSFNKDPRVVFAFRVGGAANLGAYEFFHANTLGGKTNLRGFRSRRFAGDHAVYQSTEIRLKLFNLNNYIFNGQTGFYLFNDIGRVWYENEVSKKWHDGYGAGIWITPFDFTALTLSYNKSYDDEMIVFNFKFLF
jgi:hypothetical protein